MMPNCLPSITDLTDLYGGIGTEYKPGLKQNLHYAETQRLQSILGSILYGKKTIVPITKYRITGRMSGKCGTKLN
jgi:hypothetical protein